jgi:hypothetical protein
MFEKWSVRPNSKKGGCHSCNKTSIDVKELLIPGQYQYGGNGNKWNSIQGSVFSMRHTVLSWVTLKITAFWYAKTWSLVRLCQFFRKNDLPLSSGRRWTLSLNNGTDIWRRPTRTGTPSCSYHCAHSAYSSTLKKEAERSSETSVKLYETTRRYFAEIFWVLMHSMASIDMS